MDAGDGAGDSGGGDVVCLREGSAVGIGGGVVPLDSPA